MKNQQKFAVKVTHSLDSYRNPDHAEHFFDNGTIEDTLSYNIDDYYYLNESEAAIRLEEANNFIKKMEEERGWIPGVVSAYIDELNH